MQEEKDKEKEKEEEKKNEKKGKQSNVDAVMIPIQDPRDGKEI